MWPSLSMLRTLQDNDVQDNDVPDIMIRLQNTMCTLEIKPTHLDRRNVALKHILVFYLHFEPRLETDVEVIKRYFVTQAKSCDIEGHTITFLKDEKDEICSFDEHENMFTIYGKSINNNSNAYSVHDQKITFNFLESNCKVDVRSPSHSALSHSSSTNSLNELGVG